ncbi:MAG: SUF system Fe-S cluster assembly protein [Chromatiales bacterium]|nr:SUF system Fe-S cluster assembly protein [Chromatiales bacterium]
MCAQTTEVTEAQAAGTERVGAGGLHQQIVDQLRTVFDPEIPVNIYDLGLVYDIEIDDDRNVIVDMTLTTPGCPVAMSFPATVEGKVREVPGVASARVELVWDPPWTTDRMTDEVKLELGLL